MSAPPARTTAAVSIVELKNKPKKQAVSDKVPAMLSIMLDVLTDANLDSQQRVVEMLKESKVWLAVCCVVVCTHDGIGYSTVVVLRKGGLCNMFRDEGSDLKATKSDSGSRVSFGAAVRCASRPLEIQMSR